MLGTSSLRRPRSPIVCQAITLAWAFAASAPAEAQLAKKGRLILDDGFQTCAGYDKTVQHLSPGWTGRAWHGVWTRTGEGVQSSWVKGHNPVLAYEGKFTNFVLEVEFRYRAADGQRAYVRIGAVNRDLDPRAYLLSVWANATAKARPPGIILEHEHWRPQGNTGVASRVRDFRPNEWHTLRIEVVGDEALVISDDLRVYGRYPNFSLPKQVLTIGTGHSFHELRRLRVYEATLNPEWTPPPVDRTTTPIASIPHRDPLSPQVLSAIEQMERLFDGRTLNGWIQHPVAPTAFSRQDLADPIALAQRLANKADPVATFLANRLNPEGQDAVVAILAGNTDRRQTLNPLVRAINQTFGAEPALYDEARFKGIALSPVTRRLLATRPTGRDRVRLDRLLVEDAFPKEIHKGPETSWVAKDGVLASTGAGRGVIYTERDFESYRLIFQVRQPSGDHFPGVLIFGQRPPNGEPALDALGGIQFAVPSGGHWDYRIGINSSGRHFRRPIRIGYDLQAWSQVEILVHGKSGKARMAIAQPPGTRAIEVLRFDDPAAARPAPIALQMHHSRLLDEYRDIRIEVNPGQPDRLLTIE